MMAIPGHCRFVPSLLMENPVVTVPALVFSFPPEQFSVSVKAGKVKTTKYLSRYLVGWRSVPPSPLHEAQSGRASART